MLARLEALVGVEHARIDYRGDLLKLALGHEHALGAVSAVLSELGYGAERAAEADAVAVEVWYDLASVGELSRVEAGVIADRILPPFARAHNLRASLTQQLRTAIVDALHDCFVSYALDSGLSRGEFRLTCAQAVEERVRPILDTGSASELARTLAVDMSEDHRTL